MHMRNSILKLTICAAVLAGCDAADNADLSGPDSLSPAANSPSPTAQFSGGISYKKRNVELASGDALTDFIDQPDFNPMTLDLNDHDKATHTLPIDFSGFIDKVVFYAVQYGNSPARGYFKAYTKFAGVTLNTVAGKVTCLEVEGKFARLEGLITHSDFPEDEGTGVFWSVEDNGYRWTDWDDNDKDHDDLSSTWTKPRDRYSSMFRSVLGGPDGTHCASPGTGLTPVMFKSDKGNVIVKEWWTYYW